MDTLRQPFSNELHIKTGLAESSWPLTSDAVALTRAAVHDGLGHILDLMPETDLEHSQQCRIPQILHPRVERGATWQLYAENGTRSNVAMRNLHIE